MNKEKQKIVPELRFPEFANDGEWKEKTIDDIKTIVTDYVANGSFASLKENVEVVSSKDYAYYIRLTDLRAGLGHIAQKYVTKKSYDFLKKSSLSGDEILMANIGANVGEVWQMPKVDKPSSLAPNMIMAKFTGNAINKFVYYFLKSELGKRNVAITISGNAHPKINKTEFKQVKVVLPENEKEQEKIADCLSSLDSLIIAETEKLDHLKNHKKGLLQQLFPANGETRPQYRFPEFANDGDWEITTLGEIAKFRRGSFPQPYGRPEWYDDENGMPFIQVYDVDTNLKIKPKTKRRISALAAEKSVFIAKGTVIITIQGSIGRVAITQYDAYIDRTLLLFEEFYKPIDKLFFAYVIQLLFEIEKEKAPGGIIKTITKEVLTSFNIYVPDVLEQQKIAKCLSSLDDLITAQTQKTKALKNHKKGLMQKLFPNINDLT